MLQDFLLRAPLQQYRKPPAHMHCSLSVYIRLYTNTSQIQPEVKTDILIQLLPIAISLFLRDWLGL